MLWIEVLAGASFACPVISILNTSLSPLSQPKRPSQAQALLSRMYGSLLVMLDFLDHHSVVRLALNHAASYQRALSTAGTLLAILFLWRLWSFTVVPLLRPSSPKTLPYWIPFIGRPQTVWHSPLRACADSTIATKGTLGHSCIMLRHYLTEDSKFKSDI
jgi:hypothetical protein